MAAITVVPMAAVLARGGMGMRTLAATSTATAMADLRRSPAGRTPAPRPIAGLLHLMWLASPALPVGGFSYSEGLECAIERHGVATEPQVRQWLCDQLELALARGDLAVISKAIPAWKRMEDTRLRNRALAFKRLVGLNDWVLRSRESSEFKAQTEQMGRSLLDWLRNTADADRAQIAACAALAPTFPVVFALACATTSASVADCLSAYAFGWCENLVQAAVKAVPLGQSAGQRILAALAADIPQAVLTAQRQSEATRQAFAPMLAIASSQHEIQYSRLFRS
jgi:urease accessory protein